MANLTINNNCWQFEKTIAAAGTIQQTLNTQDTFIDKNIQINITTPSGVATGNTGSVTKVTTDGSNAGINIGSILGTSTTTEPASGYYVAFTGSGSSKVTTAGWFGTGALSAGIGSSQYFSIPEAKGSVTMEPGDGSCSYDSCENAGIVDTDTTGIRITFKGSGSVGAKAKITTAGYAPTTLTNESFAAGPMTSSNDATASRWITGVKLTPPSSGNRIFKIVVPNGKTNDEFNYIDFRFTVDSNGNVTVDSSGSNTL